MDGHIILKLKGNIIPRGLVPIDRLFNKNYVASKPTTPEMDKQVEDCNIGLEDELQMVRLSEGIASQCKQRYLNLFKVYKDVFSWSYDDLKTFDTNII